MSGTPWKVGAVLCFVICAALLFLAWERYNTNANNVRQMNRMSQSTGLGPMMGMGELEPATPAATKYALAFAGVTAIGGVVCLVVAAKKPAGGDAPPPSGALET